MAKNYNVEFWNFVCLFGERKLLDFYSELIYPAITSDLVKIHGETTMFFHDVQHLTCTIDNEELLFVYGTLIKDTEIKRDEYYDHDIGDLKEDKQRLQNSPSSIFILSLKDHRLFFIKKNSDSPTVDNFKSTIKKFIKDIRKNIIDNEYAENKVQREYYGGDQGNVKRVYRKDLEVKYPEPNIEVIAQSSDSSIDDFINSLKSINSLKLEILEPNHELDCSDLFEVHRNKNKELGVSKSTITYKKGDGHLQHDKMAKISKEANEDENIQIEIKGKDINNNPITGNNNDFKFKQNITKIEDTPTLLTRKIYISFLDLIQRGVIRGPKIKNNTDIKIKIEYLIKMFGLKK